MDTTIIRPANDRERNMAADLLANSEPWITLRIGPDQCMKNCHDPEYELYISYTGNKPSGIILIDPKGVAGSPYIKSVAVWPDYRGSGIGTWLLSHAEDLFRGKARFIFICVSSFNHRARKLYEKCGYLVAGEFKDYIIDGASEILLHKRL
jgi:ribosomal-protein-alanine N-acetyltransferase